MNVYEARLQLLIKGALRSKSIDFPAAKITCVSNESNDTFEVKVSLTFNMFYFSPDEIIDILKYAHLSVFYDSLGNITFSKTYHVFRTIL